VIGFAENRRIEWARRGVTGVLDSRLQQIFAMEIAFKRRPVGIYTRP
jgi:hypothetical protein